MFTTVLGKKSSFCRGKLEQVISLVKKREKYNKKHGFFLNTYAYDVRIYNIEVVVY